MARYFVEINFKSKSEGFDSELENILELGADKNIGEFSFSEMGVGSFSGSSRSIGYTFPSRRHANNFVKEIRPLFKSFNKEEVEIDIGRDNGF